MLPRQAYHQRVGNHLLIVLVIIGGSLFIGMAGYHYFEGLLWIDAMLNSAMLLGGMGPVGVFHTIAGKLFASFSALYSGIVFLVVAGMLFAPALHRILHHFHLDLENKR